MTAPSGSDHMPQQIYYDAGLGTTMGEIVRGGVFGYGVDEAVINAYEWLIEHYEPGDEIFVFGFSRGAYTARSLSGFVSRCGLLAPGAPLSIRQLYERYKRGNDVLTIHQLRARPDNSSCKTEEKWMLSFSREVPVKFTGVWDAVGALSGSTHFALITGGNHDFLDTNLRRSEEFVFHALAIDEHRKAFAPTLFTKFDPKDGTQYNSRTHSRSGRTTLVCGGARKRGWWRRQRSSFSDSTTMDDEQGSLARTDLPARSDDRRRCKYFAY